MNCLIIENFKFKLSQVFKFSFKFSIFSLKIVNEQFLIFVFEDNLFNNNNKTNIKQDLIVAYPRPLIFGLPICFCCQQLTKHQQWKLSPYVSLSTKKIFSLIFPSLRFHCFQKKQISKFLSLVSFFLLDLCRYSFCCIVNQVFVYK